MKAQKRLRQTKYLMFALTVILIGVILYLNFGVSSDPMAAVADNTLQIINLNVGKADAAVISFNNTIGVIDSGTEESFPTIDSLFEDRRVSSIDYLILTHFDKDHIGGAISLLDKYDVKAIYIPDYVSDKKLYDDLMEKLSEKEGVTTVKNDTTFRIDTLEVEIIPADDPAPLIADKDNVDNNMSLLCMMTYGSRKFLFAGDVESDRIEQLLENSHDLDSDWIKIPHHGHYDPELDELMDIVTPGYAIISTSSDEAPSKKLLKLLNDKNVTVLDTMNHAVVTDCDGTNITLLRSL